MTLVDFLLSRLAEDESVARKLATTDNRPLLSRATTINHPERMLYEIQAKQTIIAEARNEIGPTAAEGWLFPLLALPYSDHDDYQEEWIG